MPLCVLSIGAYKEGRILHYPFVEFLEQVKLKKLRTTPGTYREAFASCERLPVLRKLVGLLHLEQLTLFAPPATEDLLIRAAKPSMKCLRIVKEDSVHLSLPHLRELFTVCRSLQHLKLHSSGLRLDEEPLLLGLSKASRLRQLCVVASTGQSVERAMIRDILFF